MEPTAAREWAKRVTVEAFAETGAKLSPDDPIILVATVFRYALDEWQVEKDALGRSVLENTAAKLDAFEEGLGVALGEAIERVKAELRADVQIASTAAHEAVQKALKAAGGDQTNRHRLEGALVGAILVLAGVLARGFWH